MVGFSQSTYIGTVTEGSIELSIKSSRRNKLTMRMALLS
jgi:hypothetical protein